MVTAMATNNVIASDIIKSYEGLSLKPYICAGGMKTIGYGHVINPDEKQQIGAQITKQYAEYLLEQDIEKARRTLYKYCQVPLTITQEAALISFIFNCGSGAFQASSMRQKLNRGEYLLAAEEFSKWVYAKGIKLNGLVKRRKLEREIFLDGTNSYLARETTKIALTATSTNNVKEYGIVLAMRNLLKKLKINFALIKQDF